MNPVVTVTGAWNAFATKIAAFLPDLIAAIFIVVFGWILCNIIKRIVIRILRLIHFDMIADRVIRTRKEFWEWEDERGRRTRRTLGFASLGGATLDNEENYLMKKLYTALGAIQIENQARI